MTCPVLGYNDDLVHVIWINVVSRMKELNEGKALTLHKIFLNICSSQEGIDTIYSGTDGNRGERHFNKTFQTVLSERYVGTW